jgi:hypothetical protein
MSKQDPWIHKKKKKEGKKKERKTTGQNKRNTELGWEGRDGVRTLEKSSIASTMQNMGF